MEGFVNIIKGISIALISTIIFLLIFSLILTYTNVSEQFISPVIIVITAISIFIGSSIGNFKMKRNGLLNGAIIGGILNHNFTMTIQSIIIIVAGMICGMLGGIIGINKG